MDLPVNKTTVIYAAVGVVLVSGLVSIGRSFLNPAAEPCSERYANITTFGLERNGVALNAADLQAWLAHRHDSIAQNVAIERFDGEARPLAMRVSFSDSSAASNRRPGMSYSWEPRSVQRQSAACLSYRVFFSDSFDFHRGGTLPGIRGSDFSDASPGAFAVRMTWDEEGVAAATVSVTTPTGTVRTPVEGEPVMFTRGQWLKMEQEVVLNDPGLANGILRIWGNGGLIVEKTDMSFRSKPEVAVSGVALDVFHGGEDTSAAAPAGGKIWLSRVAISRP